MCLFVFPPQCACGDARHSANAGQALIPVLITHVRANSGVWLFHAIACAFFDGFLEQGKHLRLLAFLVTAIKLGADALTHLCLPSSSFSSTIEPDRTPIMARFARVR